ncbi:MAG: DUF4446 family protein [Candidatus Paceibacterota bacterium]
MNISFSDPLTITVGILIVAVIVLFLIVLRLQSKLKRFLVDVNAHNIADSLAHVSKDLKSLQEFRKEIEDYLEQAEKRLRSSIQSVETVRFNPFQGTGAGGNQSFATAFLNEEGDGVLLSSLYSRDRVSVFSKPIKNNTSEHELSDEEKEALEKAKASVKTKK